MSCGGEREETSGLPVHSVSRFPLFLSLSPLATWLVLLPSHRFTAAEPLLQLLRLASTPFSALLGGGGVVVVVELKGEAYALKGSGSDNKKEQ